jgi:ABC-type transporter Mla subunit MlaD
LGDSKTDLRSTIKNLHTASDTIAQKLPGVADQLSELLKKTNTSLATAQTALVDIQKSAANASDMTASLRSLIVDNRGKLESIVGGIKSTSDNLKQASIEIRHSPWRLLYKPTPAEAANLNLYDSAREFANGAESLSDAAGSLRDALHDPQADRAQIQKLLQQLDASFNHFRDVESKLWLTAGQ